jgi:hypothetical protein
MNFGLFYTHKWVWAGLSSTHLMQPTLSLNTEEGSSESLYESQVGRMYYFMAGSNIPLKYSRLYWCVPTFRWYSPK